MCITNCATNSNSLKRCFTPLIPLCDSHTEIKLNLGLCDPCGVRPTTLKIAPQVCSQEEFEYTCDDEPIQTGCCPTSQLIARREQKKLTPIAKPFVIYPLHEINNEGLAVFVLDDSLKQLGYGRLNAVILVDGQETNIKFDIDYRNVISLHNIELSVEQANLGLCT